MSLMCLRLGDEMREVYEHSSCDSLAMKEARVELAESRKDAVESCSVRRREPIWEPR